MSFSRDPCIKRSGVFVGHVTHDRYGDEILPGGCAFYGSRAWLGLGGKAQLVTTVGNDFHCSDGLKGLDVAVTASGHTTVFTNIYPHGKPRIQTIEREAPIVFPEQLPPEWKHADALFIAPVFRELELAQWVKAVDAGIKGLGLQGFLKQPGDRILLKTEQPSTANAGYAVVRKPFDPDPVLFRELNAVFLSDEDVREFGSEDLVDKLTAITDIVVLTHGSLGAEIHHKGNITQVGIFETTCVDPTGAGDTFAGAFLFGLANDLSIEEAAKLASAAASITVEGLGGTTLGSISTAFSRAADVPVKTLVSKAKL